MMENRKRAPRARTDTSKIIPWPRGPRITSEERSAIFESAELRREIYEVAQMQRSLCGSRLVRRGSFEIAAELFPVRHLSGDFFCIDEVGPTTMIAIGDICGKGLLAGMWFIHVLELTRMYGRSSSSPAEALSALNRAICDTRPTPPLTSIFLAFMDCSRRELHYSNAGHPAPILMTANGAPRMLTEGGPLLGVLPHAKFENAHITFDLSDTLIAFSDGLPECRNDSDEEFQVEGIVNEIQKAAFLSTSEMLFSIVGAVQDFAGTHPREDDFTLLVARCLNREPA